jgi:hypothetical protein
LLTALQGRIPTRFISENDPLALAIEGALKVGSGHGTTV